MSSCAVREKFTNRFLEAIHSGIEHRDHMGTVVIIRKAAAREVHKTDLKVDRPIQVEILKAREKTPFDAVSKARPASLCLLIQSASNLGKVRLRLQVVDAEVAEAESALFTGVGSPTSGRDDDASLADAPLTIGTEKQRRIVPQFAIAASTSCVRGSNRVISVCDNVKHPRRAEPKVSGHEGETVQSGEIKVIGDAGMREIYLKSLQRARTTKWPR